MPEAHETDNLLVAQAQRGDAKAFGCLVERYQDALHNGLYRMVSQREDAEDLAQEVFVKAYRSIGRFEGRSSFYTWLYSIAINVATDHRRKTRSRPTAHAEALHPADPDEPAMDVRDRTEGPDVLSERRELSERVEQAIAKLDDDHREVVVLRDIEGFDYTTIAELLGCPEGTVKSRLHRGRLALRELLKDLVG